MNNIPKYPKIEVTEDFTHITEFRIKRSELWYDLIVKEKYLFKSIDRFKDRLMLIYLYHKESIHNKPSLNQSQTIYTDFQDENWQNRIRKQFKIKL